MSPAFRHRLLTASLILCNSITVSYWDMDQYRLLVLGEGNDNALNAGTDCWSFGPRVDADLHRRSHLTMNRAGIQVMYRAYVRQLEMSKKEAKLKVVVFLGSSREGRMGDRVAKFVTKYLESTNHEVYLIDPVELKLPLLEKPLFFYPDQSKAPKVLQDTDKLIQDADAFVVVSCEYNHSIPPALANTLDHFSPQHFAWRPSGIVTYSPGQFGGMRCAMQLRCMLGELGCLSVSNIFGIPKVHEALDEQGKPLNDYMKTGINTLVTQLDWHATAMKRQRETVGVPPPPKSV